MNLPSQTKRNTLSLAVLILLIAWIGVYLFLEQQLKKSIQEEFQRVASGTESLFDINIENSKAELSFKLDRIVAAEGLAKAIAQKDYEQINLIVAPYYKQLKITNKAVNILTFRSEDGVTLFRAHKPEYFGDMLNEKRSLIMDTNFLQRSLSGFEVGNLEMTYRITKPIFYNNVYVGNVELGINPANFLQDLSAIFKTDIGIAVDKSQLDILLDKTAVKINDKLLLIRGSQNLKEYFLQKEGKNLELCKIDMNIPLKNHLSQTLGYLVIGFDISDIVKKDTEFMHRLFFIIAVMMLFLVLVLLQGFDKILKYFSKQVYIDHLTGLLNRHALNDALFSQQSKVLILSNIKEFSLLNELYGVDAGNEILIQAAGIFKNFADEYGFDAYRISSDEFVLLKKEESFDEESYFRVVEDLHSKMGSLRMLLHGVDESVAVEIYSGVAFDHAHSLEDAQMALKKAKKESLSYIIYSKKVDTKEQSQTVMKVKRTIKHALEHKNVLPFFQPITNRDGKIVKYEALMRMVEFDGGEKRILYPNEFLSIAMNSGLYIKMAKDIVKESLAFFAKREERVSINFLPNDFFNPLIMEVLMSGIEMFDSPARIVVEITEQEGVENFGRLLKVVKKLRAMGVLIAIDDFGSGYANYVHILEIKPDYLKIDGSLVRNILTDTNSKILVKSIVRFAQELNITTVAEYVENEEIFELLKEYGVDEFQGYYLGRPTDLINKN
ncbi:MAG: EAL domain-containing protein [Sulfurimonas sp.]|uniref:EAL domain-containing protein n=1 Tax=Sulfurimonas sp. TaxID=2022749 RepID=UPI0026370198|nr:EAL domain-containing protein [Sulfurimonas sp.]MDD5373699.1 EAL domain-containing protein [Sulfurimonas sp.]